MKTIALMQARALALRSSIHNEECLSAVELAGMNAKKTNEIIDVVNGLCGMVELLAESGGLKFEYNEETESLDLVPVMSE